MLIILSILSLLLSFLAACSPGHVGGNEIAFIRDGHLWTIDPDGSNAFEVVAQNTPVVGYGWSPDHHIFVFRALDETFARTPAARHITADPFTGLIGDLPTSLNTIGIDGGSPIPINFSSPDIQYSNAWWNSAGTRLLYREEPFSTSTSYNPATVLWEVSQNDQPAGIARKSLPGSYSIPSLASSDSMVIGSSQNGVFTSTIAGTNIHYIITGTLPGHPLFATLERMLWQPAHMHPSILYALASSSNIPSGTGSTHSIVQLVLRDSNGHATMLTTCACSQFAWSPDGDHILYSTGAVGTLLNLDGTTLLTMHGEVGSVPYWSPDSRFLLLDGLHTLSLVSLANKQQQLLLADSSAPVATEAEPVARLDVNVLLQPVANNLWAADSRHFLFLTRNRLLWRGQRLGSRGLYTASITGNGQLQGAPGLVDTGNDTQPGWTYANPNTSFLL